MIDLYRQVDPYDLELPYGLKVTVKPLKNAGMAAAQAAARRAVEAIERQARERTQAGPALDGLPGLSAEAERDGFYQAQLIRELAVRHIESWTGVELKGGPAPPTRENVAAVMELYPVGERFFQKFTLRQVLLNAAKNGCGPSAAGTSSRGEGPPPTAGPAATTACPAPGRARSRRAALPVPRACPDQPTGARSLGLAARLPGPAAARAERARDRSGHECSAPDRLSPRRRLRCALGAAAGGRGRPARGSVGYRGWTWLSVEDLGRRNTDRWSDS